MEKAIKNQKKGYTIAEMVVVVSLIMILSFYVVANYNAHKQSAGTSLAAQQLASDIRMVIGWAMSQKEHGGLPGNNGWGVYFNRISPNNSSYIYFYDIDSDKDCQSNCNSGSAERKEVVSILNDNQITRIRINDDGGGLTQTNSASVIFVPPDPIIDFCDQSGDCEDNTELEIELNGEKTILINKYGMVDVD